LPKRQNIYLQNARLPKLCQIPLAWPGISLTLKVDDVAIMSARTSHKCQDQDLQGAVCAAGSATLRRTRRRLHNFFSTSCGAKQYKERTAYLQPAFLHVLCGPIYKPHESTPFEIRRSTATVINYMQLFARQHYGRARLSFGLTSSCYRIGSDSLICHVHSMACYCCIWIPRAPFPS